MLSQARFVIALVCAALIVASLTAPVSQGQQRSGIAAQGASLDLITSVPRTMTYQGILKDSEGNPVDGLVSINFAIFDVQTGGISLWSETLDVDVLNGIFSVILGNTDPLNLPFDVDYYLELEVDSEILSPRQKLNMVAYAAVSDTADYARTAAGGGWVDDGAVVRLETSTDKVGIGTASPANQVHIFGSDSAPLLNVEKVGPGRGIRVSTSGACALWVENSGNHGLRVTNANGDGIHVENAGGWAGYFNGTGYFSGDVGIGTTDPDYKLDVQGTVGIDIGSYFGDVPLTIDVPANQAALISRIAKGGSVINVVDKDGNVGIGTFSPQGALDVSSTTGAFVVPRMTTVQRNALTAVNGMIIYNTTTNQFNFHENGAWVTK